MSTYNEKKWVDGDVIGATDLNRMEKGISDANKKATDNATEIEKVKTAAKWVRVDYINFENLKKELKNGAFLKAVCTPNENGNMCYMAFYDLDYNTHEIFSYNSSSDTETVELFAIVPTCLNMGSIDYEFYSGPVELYKMV